MTGPAGTPAGRAAGTAAGTGPTSPPATAAAEDQSGAGTDTEDGAGTPRRRGGRRLWLGLAAAVLLVALVLAVVALVRTPSQEEVRESALVAARTYATSLTTFDARTLDADVERVTRASTEDFAQEYEQTIEGLRATIAADGTVSAGSVVGAGIEELDDDTATVLVAVNQRLDGTAAEPRTEANRLRMVLERRDDRWLIRSVERL